ncbi:hypothetical protein SAMN05216302_100248 [Nitrosomonas aestuarii]|uniref:Transposase n=1 Tax=Nitrosomonas aestuarii TaxID=52441 RepID=A0A1I3XR94_9PROT|nr:hypothetical protein SAMN05216302_100248 [Nitrosomonas aestuarii]
MISTIFRDNGSAVIFDHFVRLRKKSSKIRYIQSIAHERYQIYSLKKPGHIKQEIKVHSVRSASTGLSLAARMAGRTPAASPINIDTTSAPRT